MKCAMELVAIKAKAIYEYEQEEKRKDEEAKDAFLMMKANSTILCDTYVNDKFVIKANNREELLLTMYGSVKEDRIGNKYMRVFEIDRKGHESFIDTHCYAVDAFVENLKNNCFEVSVSEPDSYNRIKFTIYVPRSYADGIYN